MTARIPWISFNVRARRVVFIHEAPPECWKAATPAGRQAIPRGRALSIQPPLGSRSWERGADAGIEGSVELWLRDPSRRVVPNNQIVLEPQQLVESADGF